MIGRIKGTLIEIADNTVLVDVAGVAYEIEVSSRVLGSQPALQEQIVLHTHFVVREDAQLLFGFAARSERDLFRAFIKLNGVGPKLALSLISSLAPENLAAAVRNNDVSLLTKVPGVGKKTAERLLLELKSRIDTLTENGAVPAQVVAVDAPGLGGAVQEAEDALVALGYRVQDAQRAVALATQGADPLQLTAEEIVRQALRNFANRVADT